MSDESPIIDPRVRLLYEEQVKLLADALQLIGPLAEPMVSLSLESVTIDDSPVSVAGWRVIAVRGIAADLRTASQAATQAVRHAETADGILKTALLYQQRQKGEKGHE